jgi:hypothetical protein
MSDGPHRSLPMRRRWKRVAESADNKAFEREEIRNAIIPALEQDCMKEMSPEFLSNLRAVCSGQEGSLFKNEVGPQLESLRDAAGSGIGRVVLDHAIQISASEKIERDIAGKALTNALTDRAARGARQVEEHYCRESTKPRANRVRERIEQAISHPDMEGLARQILTGKRDRSPRPSIKRQGLDDGVKL